MKKIAIEEHFTTEEHLDHLQLILQKRYPNPEVVEEEKHLGLELPFLVPERDEQVLARLLDPSAGRIKELDQTGIDMQVLSLVSPGVQVFEAATATKLAKKMNNGLSKAIREFPERLSGFASVALQNPEEAADELERAVKELGLRGVLINSHTKGEYLDDKKYRVFLQRVARLRVPLYIHPRAPSPAMIEPYLGYPLLSTPLCGFGAEVSLHALRLICSGLFDELPELKIILGHLGEALPFWLWRLDNMWERAPVYNDLQKTPSQYFKDNFLVTTSGLFSQPALLGVYQSLGADRILFAVDHPFESNEAAIQFMKEAPISDTDKEKIFHLNAEKTLSL